MVLKKPWSTWGMSGCTRTKSRREAGVRAGDNGSGLETGRTRRAAMLHVESLRLRCNARGRGQGGTRGVMKRIWIRERRFGPERTPSRWQSDEL